MSLNGENFLSSDDLAIYLWDLENPDKAFVIVDIKPEKMEELNEVITTSTFSPFSDYNLAYGTSKSMVKLLDNRENSILTTTGVPFEDPSSKKNKNFFTEIVTSISDLKFTGDGTKLLARDFLTTKIWDIKMPSQPLQVISIFEPLKSKLCDFYENDCIFDKFDLNISSC